MAQMAVLQLFLSQLGVGGGLLFGLPLVVMGLSLRGLSRQKLHRLTEARRHRRRVADLAEGPASVVGIARTTPDGRLVVEERGGARVYVELGERASVRPGTSVLVFGAAAADVGGEAGYRQDARAWSIDARGDDAMLVLGLGSLPALIARMRLQAIAGALVFGTGLLVVAATSAASCAAG
jgi:hypothetical protein